MNTAIVVLIAIGSILSYMTVIPSFEQLNFYELHGLLYGEIWLSIFNCMTEEQARALAPPGVEVINDINSALCWKRRRHPLYASVALTLLAEIINAR